jgi:dTDP-glucose pyrophosphorylase
MNIFYKSSIKTAIRLLNQFGTKTLVVLDKNKSLKGTISDGDIRRAILKGKKLENLITGIYNSEPIYLIQNSFDESKLKSVFLKHKIDIIPIVNKKGKFIKSIKFYDLINSFKKNNNKKKIVNNKINNASVIIMAGGLGKRMEPFTHIMPKPLIPIGKSTIIELVIAQFTKYGFNDFLLTTNYKHYILDIFFKNIKLKSNLKLIREKKPLGTAGSLSLIKGLKGKNCFVANCDGLLNLDLNNIMDYHVNNHFDLTIIVSMKKYQLPYGICKSKSNGLFDEIIEKPKIDFKVNTGIYVMKNSMLKYVPKNKKIDMNNFIELLKNKKFNIGLYPISSESWLDVGQWEEYKNNIKKIS